MPYSSQGDVGRLAVGAVWSILGKFSGRFLAVLGDIVAARILGPALFGLYSIGWTLIRIIGLVAPLGLPVGLMRYLPPLLGKDEEQVRRLVAQAVVVSLGAGIAIGLLLYGLAPWLARSVYHKPALTDIFRLFSLIIPFTCLLSVTAGASRSTQDMRHAVLIEDFGQPLVGLVLVVAVYLVAGRWLAGVILSDLLSYVLMGFAGLVVVRRVFSLRLTSLTSSPASGARIGEVLAFSMPAQMAGAFAVFVFWADRLLVGYFLPAYENGLYQAASQISVVFVSMLAAFSAILAPMFADLHSRGERGRLEEIYRVGTKWQLYLGMPLLLVIAFAPAETLEVLFGARYAGAASTLSLLLIGQVVCLATGSVGALLAMTGNQRIWFTLSGLSLASNVLLCSLLIPRLGMEGAAISTSISLSLMYVCAVAVAKLRLDLWPYDRRYRKGGIAFLSNAATLLLLHSLYNGPALGFLILGTLLGIAANLGTLYLLGVDSEDREVFALLRARFPRQE